MSQTIFGLGLGKNGEFKWFVWDSVLCRKLLQTEICFNRLSPSIKSINDTMLMTIDSTWFPEHSFLIFSKLDPLKITSVLLFDPGVF